MDHNEGVRIVLVLGLHYIHVMGDAVITVAVCLILDSQFFSQSIYFWIKIILLFLKNYF